MPRTHRRLDILEIYNLHLDHAPSVQSSVGRAVKNEFIANMFA